LIKRCHEALVRTRGVAMTMVAIRTANNSAAWLGVGNVEGRLYRVDPRNKPRSEGAILRGGIVGYHLPLLRPDAVEIEPGDCFVLATDGVRADFSATVDVKRSPQENADGVLSQHFKGTDDALVLVARYIGEGHD
jgi:negative regulator of sigma-B (phosphoserine phosphatase)